jgi:hypothetical protein
MSISGFDRRQRSRAPLTGPDGWQLAPSSRTSAIRPSRCASDVTPAVKVAAIVQFAAGFQVEGDSHPRWSSRRCPCGGCHRITPRDLRIRGSQTVIRPAGLVRSEWDSSVTQSDLCAAASRPVSVSPFPTECGGAGDARPDLGNAVVVERWFPVMSDASMCAAAGACSRRLVGGGDSGSGLGSCCAGSRVASRRNPHGAAAEVGQGVAVATLDDRAIAGSRRTRDASRA